jgi:hypothetical protein
VRHRDPAQASRISTRFARAGIPRRRPLKPRRFRRRSHAWGYPADRAGTSPAPGTGLAHGLSIAPHPPAPVPAPEPDPFDPLLRFRPARVSASPRLPAWQWQRPPPAPCRP